MFEVIAAGADGTAVVEEEDCEMDDGDEQSDRF